MCLDSTYIQCVVLCLILWFNHSCTVVFIRDKGPIPAVHVSNILINLKIHTVSNYDNNVHILTLKGMCGLLPVEVCNPVV